MKGHGAVVLAGAGVLTAAAAGCGSAQGDGAPLPERVVCHAFYRADDTGAGQREETLELPRSDGLQGSERTVEFEEMSLTAVYRADAPEGRSVRVEVRGAEGADLATGLYQFGSPPPQDIAFVGGHGFTGLSYVHHGEAVLQYWCEAEGRPGT